MKHWMLMVLAIVGLIPSAYSQFNDSTNYFFNYTSTGILNKTNEGSSYVLNNGVRFSVYKKNFSISTTNSWIYGKQRDNLSNNDFSSIVDASLFKSERHIYYWALASYDKSYSLKLNYRIQSGAGVGYYLVDRKKMMVQLSDGLLYDRSNLYDTETSQHNYSIARNSFRLKFRFVANEFVVFEGTDFLQHSLANLKDYIIKSNTALNIKLNKSLSFIAVLNYNKLSVTGKENLFGNFGLTFERYF